MSTRLPRWTWLLFLPTLVGAVLLMHGLDVRAGDTRSLEATAPAVVEDHPHHESTPDEHGHCADCLAGHVMAACVAVITAFCGLGLVRRFLSGLTFVGAVAAAAGRVRGMVELARPPDPAWVRLSVMRC